MTIKAAAAVAAATAATAAPMQPEKKSAFRNLWPIRADTEPETGQAGWQ